MTLAEIVCSRVGQDGIGRRGDRHRKRIDNVLSRDLVPRPRCWTQEQLCSSRSCPAEVLKQDISSPVSNFL